MPVPRSLGELKRSGYRLRSIRDEIRLNLTAALRAGRPVFPGLIGYDDTVIPELENAILGGHHVLLLGERGQAKTRIARGLVGLLDETVPAIRGCDINDNPYVPVCARCRRRLCEEGEDLEIAWLGREARYTEKLATPDVAMADLIGDIDPIRIAEGRYLSDEETIHFGLVPRANRGIFVINELPDLSEKIQVGLFNVMEEGDVQVRGQRIRLPLDLLVVATANPEDYTSRGRIVTPLKDRFDTRVRTHYPVDVDDEIAIMEQEARLVAVEGLPLRIASYLKRVVARVTIAARGEPRVNQVSGVSVRLTINNYETLVANAARRAIRRDEQEVVPRPSDLSALLASTIGKLEFDYGLEGADEEVLVAELFDEALRLTFEEYVDGVSVDSIARSFADGRQIEVGDDMAAADYREILDSLPDLRRMGAVAGTCDTPGLLASATEFILEGLHGRGLLRRERVTGRMRYRA